MGRQAYITRLALGRSPYEAPVLSDSGEFVLGPYAHEFDNSDNYTQQYNERGHPEFRASRAAARELRRAKNDVFSTVGVVYKTKPPSRPTKTESEALKMVRSENEAGFILSSIDNLFMFCSLWWLFSLGMRVQTFQSRSVPLLSIIQSELRMFGTRGFLFAGLPTCLVAAILSSWRKYWMTQRLKRKLADFGLRQIFDVVFFSVYLSTEAVGTLQSLHLIPADQTRSLTAFIPLTRESPIHLPKTFSEALTSPVCLLWMYSSLNQHLQSMLWYVIRSVTVKPDKPDRVSYLALEGTVDAEAKIPGLRKWTWTLTDEVRFQSSKLKNRLRNLLTLFSARHQPHDEPSASPPTITEPEEADADCASTATPDPEDLFNPDYISRSPEPAHRDSNPEQRPELQSQPHSRANTLFTPLNQSPATTPPASPRVRASLIHRDSETITMQLELLESQREIDLGPQNPSLETLDESDNNGEEVEDPETAADVDTLVSELAHAIRERDDDDDDDNDDNDDDNDEVDSNDESPLHRVTALSNFASDAFASHSACLLTTAALLPLEALFVRALAMSSLSSRSLAGSALAATRPDVRPLFVWWPGWRYHATLFAILGLQGLVSSAVWGLGTAVAITLGKTKYRWGRL